MAVCFNYVGLIVFSMICISLQDNAEVRPECSQRVFNTHCQMIEPGAFKCVPKTGFNEVCRMVNMTGIRTIIFQNWNTEVIQLRPFASIAGIQELELRFWTVKIDLADLLELFPAVKKVRFQRAEFNTHRPVEMETQIEQLEGLKYSIFEKPISSLNLPKLRRLGLRLESAVEDYQLGNLHLTELRINAPGAYRFNWPKLANHSTLEVLTVQGLARMYANIQDFPYTNLRTLRIRGKRFQLNLTDFLGGKVFDKLNVLELSGIELMEETDFTPLMNLRELIINKPYTFFGKVRRFPENLLKLTLNDLGEKEILARHDLIVKSNLHKIEIVNCKIKTIRPSFWEGFLNLRFINLTFNRFKSLNLNPGLVKLTEIDLSNNQLMILPEDLLYYPKMRTINLSYNSLEVLDLGIPYTPERVSRSLQVINLTGNDLECSCPWKSFSMAFQEGVQIVGSCNDSISLSDLEVSICPDYLIPNRQQRDVDLQQLVTPPADLFDLQGIALPAEDMRDSLNSFSRRIRNEETRGFVSAPYGVTFSANKRFIIGLEDLKIHVKLNWPNLALPEIPEQSKEILKEICSGEEEMLRRICEDYQPLLTYADRQTVELREQVLKRFQELVTIFQDPILPGSRTRLRRSEQPELKPTDEPIIEDILDTDYWESEHDRIQIWQWATASFSGVMHSSLTQTRAKAFVKAIRLLAGRQSLLRDSHQTMRQDLIEIVELKTKLFENTTRNIEELYELLNSTNIEMQSALRGVYQRMNVLQKRTRTIRVLSLLGSRYLSLSNERVEQFKHLLKEVEAVLTAVQQLDRGHLSYRLLAPTDMQDLIIRASQLLRDWHPTHKLLFKSFSEFYGAKFSFIANHHGLVLQLSWPILAKDSAQYWLYRTRSISLPLITDSSFNKPESNHDYTRIKLESEYLAVSNEYNFVEVNSLDLEDCEQIGNAYHCYQNFLEKDNHRVNCMSALYLNKSAEVILDLCEVEYMFAPVNFKAEVIDAGAHLLLSGLQTPWRMQCDESRTPREMQGAPIALLSKDILCRCSISSVNGHVGRRITNCPDNEQPRLIIQYVSNEIAREAFPNLTMQPFLNNLDVMDEYREWEAPQSDTLEKLRSFRLHNTTSAVMRLRELTEELRKKGEKFDRDWDLLGIDGDITKWFTPRGWTKGVFAVGALFGFIGFIMATFLCFRQARSNGVLRSLMFMGAPHLARANPLSTTASPTPSTQEVVLSSESMIRMIAMNFTVFLIMMALIYCIKRMFNYCCQQASLYMVHPELKEHPRARIYLELSDLKDRVILEVMNVRAAAEQLHFQGKVTSSLIRMDHHTLYSILRVSWKQGDCKLLVGELELDLPALIPVRRMKRNQVQKLLEGDCVIGILVSDNSYLYKLTDSPRLIDNKGPYQSLIDELQARQRCLGNLELPGYNCQSDVQMDIVQPTAPNCGVASGKGIVETTIL